MLPFNSEEEEIKEVEFLPAEQLKISAFNGTQVNGYEKFWDSVRVEKGLIEIAEERGEAKGIKIGEEMAQKKRNWQ